MLCKPRVSLTNALLGCCLAGCGQTGFEWPTSPSVPARYAALVPFRAAHLVTSDEEDLWAEYDPAARAGEINAALARLRALGVRQVVIEAPFDFTTEAVTDKAYDGYARYNIVYQTGKSRGPAPSACQRGDMGLVPHRPLSTWANPQASAEAALTGMLRLVRGAGLTPVLQLRARAMPAHPSQCQPCVSDGECYVDALPDLFPACVRKSPGDASGLCRVDSGDVAYLDPTRDVDAFFRAYGQQAAALARVAATGGAALFVLGGGSPYLSGGGQATFADNTPMPGRRAELTGRWRQVIATARSAAQAATPAGQGAPLLGYAAHNAFYEPRPLRDETFAQEWGLLGFLDALDVNGVAFYQPGRATSATGAVDRTDLQSGDMLRYMRGHGLATDGVGGVADLESLARARGDSLAQRPVLLLEDGAPALAYAAAQPGALPERPGVSPDFEEQRRFLEARLLLIGEAVQRGAIGGIGLRLFQAGVDPSGQPRFGGQRKASLPGRGFDVINDYLGLFGTPAEQVVRDAWSPANRSTP